MHERDVEADQYAGVLVLDDDAGNNLRSEVRLKYPNCSYDDHHKNSECAILEKAMCPCFSEFIQKDKNVHVN
jgi:hypothetical protein